MRKIAEHTEPVFGLEFSPGGERLVTGSFDSRVCVFEWEAGYLKSELSNEYTKSVYCTTYTADGQYLAVCAERRENGEIQHVISLWQVSMAHWILLLKMS